MRMDRHVSPSPDVRSGLRSTRPGGGPSAPASYVEDWMTADDVVPEGRPDDRPEVGEDTETLGDRAAHALLEFRQGRTDAMSDLVREATPLLWHTVRAQGVDRDTADDVVQGVWAALVRHAYTIAEPHAVLKWLLVTARRAAWEAVRRTRDDQRRRSDLPDDSPTSTYVLPDPQPGPDAHLLRDERDRSVWRALAVLPARCQELLRLVSLADRPDYRMISAAIGMPVGSIGATRGRCLAKLRTALDDLGEDPWTA
jgi:RNA polymerase sigma factor (sigma-70 family)